MSKQEQPQTKQPEPKAADLKAKKDPKGGVQAVREAARGAFGT